MIKDLCTNQKFLNYEATAYETNNVFLKLGSITDIDVKIWFNTYGELRMNTPRVLNTLSKRLYKMSYGYKRKI